MYWEIPLPLQWWWGMRFAQPVMRISLRDLKIISMPACPWEMGIPVNHVMVLVPGTQRKEM